MNVRTFSDVRPRLGRPLGWTAALLLGAALGLALRLALFFSATLLLPLLASGLGALVGLFPVDPVYTRTAVLSLGDIHAQALIVAGAPGAGLHDLLPGLVRQPEPGQLALLRVAVKPGSALLARLVAAGLAHAGLLTIGLLLVRRGWLRASTRGVLFGVAVQAPVALSILGEQPSVRELEATGLDFGANALLPWLWERGHALSDGLASAPPSLLAAALVGLALLTAYLPASVLFMVVARGGARLLTFGSALALVLTSSACAGALQPGGEATPPQPIVAPSVVLDTTAQAPTPPAPPVAPPPLAHAPLASDRWFDEPPSHPSHVDVQGGGSHYQLLVNGQPQVIQGMGLNTQYTQLMTPEQRAAQLEADMAALQQLGVNTVLGWDPNEFDDVLLETAARHGIGVVMPFELDPEADYTDPAVRQQLQDQVVAWVERYRSYPALRMWGLGNEVLHKIVHPAWVGPQDPARERNAEAFSDWLIQTADLIHALDPDHPVTYRSAEDAFVSWVAAAVQRQGGGPRPWFVWGTNCYQDYLSQIVDKWPSSGLDAALWVSEFAPGTEAVPDRPDGFSRMWGYIRRHPDWVLGGAVYAWTRNGPEGVDRNFGLTDDGAPVDGRSLDMLATLFHLE